MKRDEILILGVGNILLTDDGFGVRVIETLERRYEFPDNVSLVDGGVLGLNLLGIIAEADHLIVVDAVRNKTRPGTLCRLAAGQIPQRLRSKNSLHQIDLLEALTLCRALGNVPQTVILGVEPKTIDIACVELTPIISECIDPMTDMVLAELSRLNVTCRKRKKSRVSCHSL